MLQALAAGAIGGIVSTRITNYYSKPSIFDTFKTTISGREYNEKYRQNAYVYNPKYKTGTVKNCGLYPFSVFNFFSQSKAEISDNATITISYDNWDYGYRPSEVKVTEATI